jgi:hypothetical protein
MNAQPHPTAPPHGAIRDEQRRRERWRDLGAALGVLLLAALVVALLPA